MTLKFFNDNYDLNDYEIKSIKIEDNKLYLDINVVAYLELIANGYRPEMMVDHEIIFIFNIEYKNTIFNEPYTVNKKYENNILYLNINGNNFNIINDNVEVVQKL